MTIFFPEFSPYFSLAHRIHVWYPGILMVNVTIYSIHGSYGLGSQFFPRNRHVSAEISTEINLHRSLGPIQSEGDAPHQARQLGHLLANGS